MDVTHSYRNNHIEYLLVVGNSPVKQHFSGTEDFEYLKVLGQFCNINKDAFRIQTKLITGHS